MSWSSYPPSESIAQRVAKAEKRSRSLHKVLGRPPEPAVGKGTKIATTFWGQAWNRNLEHYQSYEYRLPRGRSYVKNGLVLDLQVEKGCITALVSGSELYEVTINIRPMDSERWQSLKHSCSGEISSVVGLLQGKLPLAVMEAVTESGSGLFPEPRDILFICTCPDHADLCKHSAAAAYGVGARLDERPKLLFLLRGVDHTELLEGASDAVAQQVGNSVEDDTLGDLSALFGVELEGAGQDADRGEISAGLPLAAPKTKVHVLTKRTAKKGAKKIAKKATKRAVKKGSRKG